MENISTTQESPPLRLLTADQVKEVFSPHMQSLWDAAVSCLNNPSVDTLESFRNACRPGEITMLMRECAEKKCSRHIQDKDEKVS